MAATQTIEAGEIVRPASGSEADSRTGMASNCAARLGRNLERECRRKARKGDYCEQHWQMNFGHEFNLLTLECKCGVNWKEVDDEICAAKVDVVEFYKPNPTQAKERGTS